MRDAAAVLNEFPDPVLVLENERVSWANERAHRLLQRATLAGASLEELLQPGEAQRLELLRQQRAAGWNLPDTCRVRFTSEQGAEVLVDVRFGELTDGRRVMTVRDALEATRAERLMGQLAQKSSGVLMGDERALFAATEQIFLDLNWVVAFTRVLPGASRVELMISAPDDPVGIYGRTLIGREQPRTATPVLDRVVTSRLPLFLDNIPTKTQPPLPAAALAQSMSASRVARSAWCPIFTPELTHVLAVTGRDLTEHDFAAIQLFAAQVGATIRLTELRHELVKRERLAAIGETAAVLAHEVRTPLAVLFNVASALRRWDATPGADGSQHATLVRTLSEEAERLQTLVADLLDFGGMAAPRTESVDAIKVIADALDAATHEKGWVRSQPRVKFDPQTPNTRLTTDPALLRRGVLNLLINACQHVPEGGEIRLEVAPQEHLLQLRIFNEGMPLSAAVASRVFEPFFTTREDGTGLGLAIARRIFTDLGGSIAVESRADGVAFLVHLPR